MINPCMEKNLENDLLDLVFAGSETARRTQQMPIEAARHSDSTCRTAYIPEGPRV